MYNIIFAGRLFRFQNINQSITIQPIPANSISPYETFVFYVFNLLFSQHCECSNSAIKTHILSVNPKEKSLEKSLEYYFNT